MDGKRRLPVCAGRRGPSGDLLGPETSATSWQGFCFEADNTSTGVTREAQGDRQAPLEDAAGLRGGVEIGVAADTR